MMKKLLIVGALASLPLASFAESGLSYNNFGGAYLKGTQRNGNSDDVDADGYTVFGSGKFTDKLYAFGDYRHYTTDKVFGAYAEADLATVGLGFRFPLGTLVDLNAGGGAIFAKQELKGSASSFNSGDDDDTGYFVQTGVRAMVLPRLELNGGFRYSKVFDESETAGIVGAAFNFTPAISAVGHYEYGDDVNQYTIGGRFNFGL